VSRSIEPRKYSTGIHFARDAQSEDFVGESVSGKRSNRAEKRHIVTESVLVSEQRNTNDEAHHILGRSTGEAASVKCVLVSEQTSAAKLRISLGP